MCPNSAKCPFSETKLHSIESHYLRDIGTLPPEINLSFADSTDDYYPNIINCSFLPFGGF